MLRIERPLADVAFAMLDRGWLYPHAAGDVTSDPERDLVAGLARAERALAAVPAAVVRYDELIEDEEPLAAALRTLYSDVDLLEQPRYLDDGFRAVRDEVLARRRTERWRRLDALAGSI